jgi:dihydroorotate dehydrogenase
MLKSILLSFLSIFLFILKRFPPEPSKKFSLKLLKLSWKYFSFLPIFNSNKSKVIEKKIILNDLSFKNNVGIAAGLDKEGKYFSALGSLGFGFVEVGTFTPKAQEGNTKPRIKRLKNDSIINRLGFNNPGIDEGIKNIKRNINNFNGVLGISIGKNKNTELKNAYKDYIFCMNRSYEVADYLALNISSPNTEGLRDLASEEFIEKLIREVTFEKRRLKEKFIKNVPIYIKISPDESDKNLFHLINLSEDYGIDGFIVSNTYVGEAKGISGGISGSMLKEKSLHMLKKVNSLKRKNSTLISSGGISSKSDVKERMENGADLIQIYTSFVYRGPAILEELVN